jgi:hypothetical protein
VKYCKTEGYYLLRSISLATTCQLAYCMNCSSFSSLPTHPHTHTNRYFWKSKCKCLHNQYEMQQNCSMFHLKPYKRKSTYKATLRHLHKSSNYFIFWVCVYSMQSTCAISYCHLWLVWVYHIFPHYIINSTIFEGGGGGKSQWTKNVFFFISLQILSETFLILWTTKWHIFINVQRSSCIVPIVILVRF